MKKFIVYNERGKILRVGRCQNIDFYIQAKENEFVMEGMADEATQKIINVGIAGKVFNKTPQEIEAEKPPELPELPEIPESQRPATITNEQLQDILKRLDDLEKSV